MKVTNEVFVGSITGLSNNEQEEILEKAYEELKDKKTKTLKISISPIFVNKELLKKLKKYKVSTIEIEAQSMNDYILKKCGYSFTSDDIKKATKMIKWNRFNVAFQVGIGLPESTRIDELYTAKKFARLRPKKVRIYPMVVMKNTRLEEEYNREKYEPLTLNQAVERCKEVIYEFNRNHIKQISIIKQNELDESEQTEIIAGPYHKEFGQLVTDSIWYDSIVDKIKKFNVKVKKVKIEVNPKELPNIIGYEEENAKRLKDIYDVEIKAEGNPDIKIGKSEMSILEVYSN